MRIAQVGYAMNDAWLASEQRRGQDRQGGIFRAAHLDRTRERMATVNEDLIHTWQKGIGVYLNNRFPNKCGRSSRASPRFRVLVRAPPRKYRLRKCPPRKIPLPE